MYDSRSTKFSHHRNENYGKFVVAMKFDENNYRECCYGEGVQFRLINNHQESMESDDSGVCSPPLWKNSPSPPKSPSQPLLGQHNYRSLSPNSRLQAIARGQFELMEMVKNMPESSYELSLKDLVEHHRGVLVKVKRQEIKKNDSSLRSNSFENKGLFLKLVFPISLKSKKKKNMPESSYELSLKDLVEHHRLVTQIPQVERLDDDNKNSNNNNINNQTLKQRGVLVKVKRQEIKKNDSSLRSNSFENKGLFLKLVFPISLKSKKKKNYIISGKVSPKPEVLKDWWKKRFTGSSDSDSDSSRTNDNNSGSTGSSSHSGDRKTYGFLSSGCWPFFQTTRRKSAE